MQRPRISYVPIGEGYVAYSVCGEGPDLVYNRSWWSHLDAQWDIPLAARFFERLASFSRLIMFDRRGHGMSDQVDLGNLTLEQWMEDLLAVLDATGARQPYLLGELESGPMQVLHAATHPNRARGLILFNTLASFRRRPGYPAGMPDELADTIPDALRDIVLGTNRYTAVLSPGADPGAQRDLGRLTRYALGPGLAHRLAQISIDLDIRDVLPTVRVPTLVLHRREQQFCRVDHGRYVAEHIAGARLVELAGGDVMPYFGEQEELLDEIEEFVTGSAPARHTDRSLATLLFTDIVASTEQLVDAGDRQWRDVLDQHNRAVRAALRRFRGTEVSTAGDGFVTTFDGPARAVQCACEIVDEVGRLGLQVRAGLHTGEIGVRDGEISGIAVHIAARVGDLARPAEVLVSRTVVDLVAGSGLRFTERGSHELKGVPGEFQLFAVQR